MTHEQDKISDTDLHAYVDGELDQARAAQVERYLAKNPEKASEVADWQKQNEALHGLFAPVAKEPLPARLDPYQISERNNSSWHGWRALAAMISLFVLGVGTGWFSKGATVNELTASLQKPVLQQALLAHATYSVEVLHPVEVGADNEKHLVSWLSKRLKTPIKAPKLNTKGFALIGGRLLPGNEGAAAQFMYEDQNGKRLTLYIIRDANQKSSAFRFASYDDMNSFYWLDNNVSYAVVGDISRPALSPLAHEIYTQLSE